jgi:hypothetical protein
MDIIIIQIYKENNKKLIKLVKINLNLYKILQDFLIINVEEIEQ